MNNTTKVGITVGSLSLLGVSCYGIYCLVDKKTVREEVEEVVLSPEEGNEIKEVENSPTENLETGVSSQESAVVLAEEEQDNVPKFFQDTEEYKDFENNQELLGFTWRDKLMGVSNKKWWVEKEEKFINESSSNIQSSKFWNLQKKLKEKDSSSSLMETCKESYKTLDNTTDSIRGDIWSFCKKD